MDEGGAEVARRRVTTPAGDYAATLEAIVELVAFVERRLGARGSVGIGTPGSLDPQSGLLRNSNSVVLNGRPLGRDLCAALGREIRLANDANCLALSEAIDGAGADCDVVFAIVLGTGVGGGIAVGRRVLSGRNAVAGEWGHNPLPWMRGDEYPGAPCFCGKHGCIETFLSGPGFARTFPPREGRAFAAHEIVALADAGDREALGALATYEDRLARALAHAVNLLDPDAIVAGGGLSNVSRFYRNVPALVERYAVSRPLGVRFIPAVHGDSSGVRGAARLWPIERRGRTG